jgi:hypothetical protein
MQPIEELMAASLPSVNFGDCVCGTVHERKLGIIMLTGQEQPRIITIRILFDDESLTELPEYIFGVRKENTCEYFDEYKFKAMQKGFYNFVVGVKTPMRVDYPVSGRLELALEGTKNVITIPLQQVPRMPEIKCSRELVSEEGIRLIKLGVMKNRSRKEVKLAFKSTENLTLNLLVELVGLGGQNDAEVDVKPKSLQVGGKGIFLLSFIANGPSEMENKAVCARRILVVRVKDTKIHFHFPLEVTFYPGGEKN